MRGIYFTPCVPNGMPNSHQSKWRKRVQGPKFRSLLSTLIEARAVGTLASKILRKSSSGFVWPAMAGSNGNLWLCEADQHRLAEHHPVPRFQGTLSTKWARNGQLEPSFH